MTKYNQNNPSSEACSSSTSSLQEKFLRVICEQKLSVSIYLVNGIKLQGYIDSFDQHVIVLRDPIRQIIYKHNICTILPTNDVSLAEC